jgi:NAD(P)H-hydrate epimerase
MSTRFRAIAQAASVRSSPLCRAHSSSSSSSSSKQQQQMVRFLSQREAQDVDAELMDPNRGAFTLQQLMELAGQSVACAVYRDLPPTTHPRVNVLCGPGNNGGDGLVCARHLQLFGYSVRALLPKPITNEYFKALAAQCRNAGVRVDDGKMPLPSDCDTTMCNTVLPTLFAIKYNNLILPQVIDAIFGFSFSGEVREPFAASLRCLHTATVPVVSVDIPSGWDVEQGAKGCGWSPQMLVSLTAPKLCSREFKGRHWLGGRFVPPEMACRLQLQLPEFTGTDCVVLLHDAL